MYVNKVVHKAPQDVGALQHVILSCTAWDLLNAHPN